jgi:hypothetical protein
MSKVHNQVKEPATDTTAPADIDPIVKSNLDIAWGKIEKGLAQEAEGRKLWVDGTIELITILHDARKRLGADQEFGTWLTDNGYGENRITRHQRAALLNMAEHLDLTREVLEQTHRLSWRHIWEEEVQPQLPHVGQPPDGKTSAAGQDGKSSEEAPAKPTRRPKNTKNGNKPPPKGEWAKDRARFRSDGLLSFNIAIAMKDTALGCAPEEKRKLLKALDKFWLEKLDQAEEALAFLRKWTKAPLEQDADKPKQKKSRVRTIPARRAPRPVQQPSP